MRKKGQTEVFGVILVVFIMSIGLFYVVNLKLSQRDPNIFNVYQDTELAHATILALLNSDIDGCISGTLENNIKKLGQISGCENDIKTGLEKMLEGTIGEGGLNRTYAYEIYSCNNHNHPTDDSCVQAIGPFGYDDPTSDVGRCMNADYDASSNIQPISTMSSEIFYFKLSICRI